jgi:hypothetical protein
MVFLGQRSTRDGDVDPIQEGNGAQNEQQEHQKPAHPAGRLISA